MTRLQDALRLVEANPGSAHSWCLLGELLRSSGQQGPAIEAFQQAVRRQPSEAAFRGWAACAHELGQLPQAVAVLTVARQRGLLGQEGQLVLAQLAMDAGDLDAAADVLTAVTARWPGTAHGWLLRAITDTRRGRADAALLHLDRAVALDGTDPEIHANRAAVQETLSDLPGAEASARRALALQAGNHVATLTLARVMRRRGQHAAALEMVEQMDVGGIAPHHGARRQVEIGLCRDRLGDEAGAWQAFRAMNAEAARRPGLRPEVAAAWSATLDRIRADAAGLATSAAQAWTVPDDGRAPVFVVGFPRSGTTLLETMLGAHPALQATDEMPVTDIVLRRWDELLPDLRPYPAGLHELTAPHRAGLRAAWLATLDEVRPGLDPQRRVIDKVPLNLVHLPLLHALFPESPKVVLLRDPRDTALSCFMQDFALGATNNLMLDMDSIVDVQARAFDVFHAVRPILGQHLIVVRYEELVEDHLAVSRRLVDDLGLPWHAAVEDYRSGLVGAHITTPSYTQVVQPVHTRARERWRRYARELAPWRARLDETAHKLGYPVA